MDFLANFDVDGDFPQYDAEFEQALTQIDQQNTSSKKPNCESVMEDHFPEYDAEFEQVLTQVEQQSTGSSTEVTNKRFASPKGKEAVKAAKESSIPVKTHAQTNWSLNVWEQWAQERNAKLLPGEIPFSTNFCDLSMIEMDFWLSRFILEVRKLDGKPYPPNTIYQLICGLQRQLHQSGRADVKLLDNPSLHGFKPH